MSTTHHDFVVKHGLSLADDKNIKLGSSDEFKLYHTSSGNSIISETGGGSLYIDGTNIYLRNGTATGEAMADFVSDGAVSLYYNNSKKFETTSAGATLTGDFTTTGNVGINGAPISSDIGLAVEADTSDSSTYAFIAKNAAGNTRFYVRGDGVVAVSGSQYLYAASSGTGFYVQNNAVFRGDISNDSGDLSLADNVNITGNVGIGTTSPATKLEISSGGADVNTIRASYDTNNYLEIAHNRISAASSGTDAILFQTSGTNRAIINTTGLGIGTTSPDAPLTIHSSSDPEIRVGYNSSQDHRLTWDSSKLFLDADPDNANNNSALGFRVDGSLVGYFTDSGNFGIGASTSLSYKLQVRHDVLASTDLDPVSVRLYNNSDGGAAILFENGVSAKSKISFGVEGTGASTDETFIGFSTGANTSMSERMRIDSSGKVGIGTASPAQQLSIAPDTDISAEIGKAHVGMVGHSDYAGFSHVDMNAGSSYALLQSAAGVTFLNAPAGQSIKFRIGNANKMLLNSSGFLGIGTSSPTHLLHVAGDIRINAGSALKLYNSAGNAWAQIAYDATNDSIQVQRSFIPSTNNYYHLGTTAVRWGTVYAVNLDVTNFSPTNIAITSGTVKLDGDHPSGTNNVALGDGAGANFASGDVVVITDLGSGNSVTKNNRWSGLAGTTTNANLSTYVQYEVGDLVTIANADNTASGSARKVTGKGAHLTEAGDFLVGDVSSNNFIFFSPDSDEITIKTGGVLIDQIKSNSFNLKDIRGNVFISTHLADSTHDGAVRLHHAGLLDNPPIASTSGSGLVIEAGMNVEGSDSGHFITRSLKAKDSNGLSLRTDDNQVRLFIKDDGNVGIGTTAPAASLHVQTSGTGDTLLLESTDTGSGNAPNLTLWRNSSSPADGDAIGRIKFNAEDDAGNAHAFAQIDSEVADASNTTENGTLNFRTQVDGTLATRLAIDSAGRVGVGTTAPNQPLDVQGNIRIPVGSTLRAEENDGTYRGAIRLSNTSTYDFGIFMQSNGSSPALHIRNSDRNVGIGTTIPTEKLQVSGRILATGITSQTSGLRLESLDTSVNLGESIGDIEFSSSDTSTGGSGIQAKISAVADNSFGTSYALSFQTGSSANPTEKVRIDNTGNLQLSTASTSIGAARIGLKFQTGFNQFGAIHPFDITNDAINDDTTDLGQSNARFDDVYATNGTIQTSDQDEKQDFEALSDAEKRVAVAAKGLLKKFRWKSAVTEKGDNARIHFGIVAQELEAAFTAEGLDAGRYGMFISSTWTEDGIEKTRGGVRYHELLAFIIASI